MKFYKLTQLFHYQKLIQTHAYKEYYLGFLKKNYTCEHFENIYLNLIYNFVLSLKLLVLQYIEFHLDLIFL